MVPVVGLIPIPLAVSRVATMKAFQLLYQREGDG